MSIFGRLSFKDQAFKLREDAILDAATRILAGKGFDLMTMDDVALEVGISKPSLYKHFKSKEDLVGEALIRLIDGALEYLEQLPGDLTGLARLRALLEWALRVRLTGGLPFLPSTSPHVREMLTRNLRYVTRVLKLNRQLEKLVAEAKAAGELDPSLPDDVILFSYYARTCDPAVDYLQLYSKLGTDAIVEHMLKVSFEGMRSHL
ncbi:TetR/AcrR family transcriptional regulator [Cupriavidus basilensis]|uniref:TetR/AcrR family transcriptional regulator n=1 Tax=Cupriavidus basilensis TaxID=68895 RepID=A0A643G066_9BURK|nr:TetR/AcrR family transcriptional regulator [Cupriavidus basilensis]QOT78723.1 TetR/AcrR family transcriptional regulator [Cupriavidus basilensis]